MCLAICMTCILRKIRNKHVPNFSFFRVIVSKFKINIRNLFHHIWELLKEALLTKTFFKLNPFCPRKLCLLGICILSVRSVYFQITTTRIKARTLLFHQLMCTLLTELLWLLIKELFHSVLYSFVRLKTVTF